MIRIQIFILSPLFPRWIDQCTFAHDGNRKTADNQHVGQNLWWGMGQTPDRVVLSNDAIQGWYNEVKDFPSSGIGSFDSGAGGDAMIGHFTQVIWGNSGRVGCGYINYKDGSETVSTEFTFG